jgi:hypothetical protein
MMGRQGASFFRTGHALGALIFATGRRAATGQSPQNSSGRVAVFVHLTGHSTQIE